MKRALMRRILHDQKLQAEFEENGYVVVPFLERSQIRQMLDLYASLDYDLNAGFHATILSKKVDVKRKVNTEVEKLFAPIANKYLLNYKPLLANYTVKEPGKESLFEFHLDWSMVDEDKHISITVWCPLMDVDKHNGNLVVLKGSHRLGRSMRGHRGMFIYTFDKNFKDSIGQCEKVALALKAGEAVIYDHKLFHGSPPNMTDKVRVAINQAMIPVETESVHYQINDNGYIDIYQVDKDFYARYDIDLELDPTEVQKIGSIKADGNFLRYMEMEDIIPVE